MEYVSTLGLAYLSCSGDSTGWLNFFMNSINKTYPNPGHILINNG